MKNSIWPTSPEDIRHYRALGSICRQKAVLHPEANWFWLSQAERWEYLAATAPALADCDDLTASPVQKAA